MVKPSLVDLLYTAAERWPDRPIRIIGRRDVTLPALIDDARRAARVASAQIHAGDRVLLLLDDIDDFLVAFWAVQFLGATAIPLAPPRPTPGDLDRVRRVLAQTRGPVVTDRGVKAPLPTIDVATWRVDAPPIEPIRSDAPALVQYSSGSTGSPRGVVLGHAQLLANVAQLSVLPWQEDDVLFVWMPHFHDMGLIGGHLLPLRIGMHQVRMDAATAMRNPLDWLKAAHDLGATILSSTNFGLTRVNARLAAGAVPPDLSRIRMVVNGAEPISADVCRAFSRLTGIPESAHFPMYGLAEASVGVAAPRVPGLVTTVIEGREVVLHGPLLPDIEARFVDGELRVRGPNVTAGYLDAPEDTAALFDEDGFLRTGDLAALVDGQLAVIGRRKDVIAVNGRKLHAHDVEALVEGVPGVRAGGAVALSDTRGDTEGLAIAVQLAPEAIAAPTLWAVRRTVADALGVEPTAIVPIPAVPRTTSGKKRRAELRAELRSGALDDAVGNTVDAAVQAFSSALGRPIAPDAPLADAGVSSLKAVDALGRLGDRLGVVLDHRLLLRATTLTGLARLIEQEAPTAAPAAVPMREPVAIVALACRLPGSDDALAFWDDVLSGTSRIGPGPVDRPIAGLPGGWLADVDRFEPERWRISAADAAAMDPQQRLLLGLATDALEPFERVPRTGVFVGAGQLAYAEVVRDHLDEVLPAGTLAGNLLSMLAARIAHHLDLRGPALTVDTACSAGLVAVHLACRSLQDGECERAVAAAVNLNLTPTLHHLFGVAGALSPTGRCLPFAPEADGTVPGEGAVVFVLEPLSAAKARGARVLAVLRGTAINNDGTSLSVMAPNPAGQEDVIRRAIVVAGVDPAAVSFVEAHGTGTPVGDGVERAVLARAYPSQPRIGATKGHVGHLMGAAGAVGLLRTLGELGPGELGAVSSFGFGGTNAHVLVEGGPDRPPRAAVREPAASRRFWLGAASADGLLHAAEPDPAGGLSFRAVAPGPMPRRGSRALVTGATGALGRALCRVLVDAGVDVVGVARKPSRGVACRFVQGDVADPHTAELVRALGPFDLGFHLAGALEDPMRAKRDGLANLRDVGVHTWVLASSVSAAIPGLDRGLEAYAAANRALIDAAHRARAAGRSDVAVSLAPVEGDGLARDVAGALQARGIPTLTVAEAVATLLGAVGGPAHVVAMRRAPVAPTAALPDDVAARVAALVAQAAGLEHVDPDASLGSLGIDSVAALDVLKDLERVVGHGLPTTLLYENDTIAKIIAALGGASRVASVDAGPPDRLLPSQQTFVIQDAFFPDMPGNVLISVDVEPRLERAALEGALVAVVARHPALSSVIRELRQVEGAAEPRVSWVESVDRAAIADERFDLATGPLLRVITDGRTLVLNGHHAIVDAWSTKIVLEDLLALHEALRAGRPATLPPLRSTHRDVGRALLEVSPDAIAAWKAKFADGVPPLHLDWDAPVDAPSSGGCGAVRRVLEADQTAALEARARAAGVSLPALVLAAWAERLYAWTGQHDVVIRVAHGRREARLPDIERVVGAFADGLPVRISQRHGESLEQLAQLAQAELAFGAAHAGASSLALASVAEHGPSGPVGLTPAGFTFPLLPAPEPVGGLRLDEVHGAAGAGFTRITLIAWVFRGRLHLTIGHARSHLSSAKANAKANDLVAALTQVTQPLPATIHGRVLRSCRAFPDRPAVGDLTYRALDERSGALAKRLPAGRVGVLGAQGPEAAIALLAVLRSGGAFIPLDPEWPDARILQLLASSSPSALVTTAVHADRARAWGPAVIVVDDERASDGPDAPAELAYVMYTSGSTGRPKGVVVHHAEHLVFQEWVARAFGVTGADRFVGTSSLGYGGALRQIFTPLLHGGQSCPVPRDIARDPDALAAFIDEHGITVWNSVPSMWGHLMDAAQRRGTTFPSLRWVLIGGEAVPAAQVRRWRSQFCGRVANLYGSTETIVNATMHEIVRDPPSDAITAPIGWPRGGTPVHLLDVEHGVGELAVGGAIARGYWEDPEATAAAFVDDPVHGRLYRTGDRARRRTDGSLEYIGRADAQVQVHGNRVELPEIEHVIAQAPGVRAASVVYEQGFLIAFVDGATSPESLRAFVAARLPAYMVPHRFEAVAGIPRNPAGKVDRVKLRTDAAAAVSSAPPARSEAATIVAAVWRETLGLTRDPSDDEDFFAVGGDSIRALEVLDRLRAQTGTTLRPLDLYQTRRLADVAALLDRHTPSRAPTPRTSDAAGPFALSAVQRGFLLAGERSPDRAPVWVARVPLHGRLDRAAFERALAAVVARHAMLRTAFVGGTQQVAPDATLALQIDDLSLLPAAARERALEARFDEELHVRFDLARPPLFRARLCRLGPEDHVVLVSSHHAASDVWSLWILARDLIAAHDGHALPPPRATFREALASEANTDDRWWRTALAGLAQTAGPVDVETTVRRVIVSPADWDALRSAARARAITPYAFVLGCVFAALRDLDGADDRVVSTALAGRDSASGDLAEVVGPFARALPVRVRGEPSIDRVAEAFRTALAHSDASAASIAAGVEGGAVLERLGRYFLTWLDPTAVPMPAGSLTLDWSDARFRFATPSTSTEVMVGVLVHDGLRIGIHGGPVVDAFASALARQLGRLARPDAALVVYPPAGVAVPFDVPTVVERVECALGRSELVLVPLRSLDGDLRGPILAATAATNARVVALAGLLPSRTGLGREPLTHGDQVLTTGHAATVCAMARTVEAALRATGRTWSTERVGVLGYGAIGQAVLALLLHRNGHPAELRIDDPLHANRQSVTSCSLVIAATSAGDVLDVDALLPGAIVVDDSFPRAFDDARALARMRDRADVLLVGGGMLDAGPLVRTSPFPQAAALRAQYPSKWLPGCHAEAVLVAWEAGLGPTIGPVELPRALAVEAAIGRAGWKAAPLHLGPWEVPETLLGALRRRPPNPSG